MIPDPLWCIFVSDNDNTMIETAKEHLLSALRVFASAFLVTLVASMGSADYTRMNDWLISALIAATSALLKLFIMWLQTDSNSNV